MHCNDIYDKHSSDYNNVNIGISEFLTKCFYDDLVFDNGSMSNGWGCE